MSYVESYNITKMYWTNYLDKYLEVYERVLGTMKTFYPEDAQACAAGVNTTMIAFTKAAGMDMAGVISFDEELAGDTPEFKSFADVKQSEPKSSGGYMKPNYSGGANGAGAGASAGGKKPYNGPKELQGPVSAKQVEMVNKFLNGSEKVRAIAEEMMADADVADPEELTKQEASNIIEACFAVMPKKRQ